MWEAHVNFPPSLLQLMYDADKEFAGRPLTPGILMALMYQFSVWLGEYNEDIENEMLETAGDSTTH